MKDVLDAADCQEHCHHTTQYNMVMPVAEDEGRRPVSMELPEHISQWTATCGEDALKPLSVRALVQELALC